MGSHYEPGHYTATIVGQRFGETPNGTPYFAIEFEPTSASPPTHFPTEVYKRELTLYFSEKAAPYSIEKLRRLGWIGTDFDSLNPDTAQYDSLAGLDIEVICRINDKGYDDWDLTAPGGASKESDPGVASKLNKLFGKALRTSLPQKVATKPVMAPAVPDDDESPF